jgi:hypothetical protein
MNLIFGLSAFVMAGITIWQNRHYLRAIKMPWGKEVCYPSPPTSTDIELTGDSTRRIEDQMYTTSFKSNTYPSSPNLFALPSPHMLSFSDSPAIILHLSLS